MQRSETARLMPPEVIEIILQIAISSARMYGAAERGWIAGLILVSRFTAPTVETVLYSIVELHDHMAVSLFSRTLQARSEDFALTRVKALRLLDHSWPDGDAVNTTEAVQVIVRCSNAFLQLPGPLLPSTNGDILPKLTSPRRLLSLRCGAVNDIAPIIEQVITTRVTHLHLAFGSETEDNERLFYIAGLYQNTFGLYALTHLAIDWLTVQLPENAAAFIARSFFRTTSLTNTSTVMKVERLVFRFLVAKSSNPRQIEKLRELQDPRIFVNTAARETQDLEPISLGGLGADGWRRHAHGVEDLWLSGTQVWVPDA